MKNRAQACADEIYALCDDVLLHECRRIPSPLEISAIIAKHFPPLRWTKELPTCGGDWFWRPDPDTHRMILEVSSNGKNAYYRGEMRSVETIGGEWCGPIAEPEE